MELFRPPNKYLSCGSAGRAQVALDAWSGPHTGGPSSGAGEEGHQLPPVGVGASPRAQDRPALRGLQNRVKLSDGGLSAVWPLFPRPTCPGSPSSEQPARRTVSRARGWLGAQNLPESLEKLRPLRGCQPDWTGRHCSPTSQPPHEVSGLGIQRPSERNQAAPPR